MKEKLHFVTAPTFRTLSKATNTNLNDILNKVKALYISSFNRTDVDNIGTEVENILADFKLAKQGLLEQDENTIIKFIQNMLNLTFPNNNNNNSNNSNNNSINVIIGRLTGYLKKIQIPVL